jgi:RNA polymerase-binding transcription factor DksA
MDETYLEMADRLATAEIAAGIERARSKINKPVDFDGACECGVQIPEARHRQGYYNCVDCQSATEARRKFFR